MVSTWLRLQGTLQPFQLTDIIMTNQLSLGCTPLHRLDYNILEEKINEIRQKPGIRSTACFRCDSHCRCGRNAYSPCTGTSTGCYNSRTGGHYTSIFGSELRTVWRYRYVRLPVRRARSPANSVLRSAHYEQGNRSLRRSVVSRPVFSVSGLTDYVRKADWEAVTQCILPPSGRRGNRNFYLSARQMMG